MKASLGRTRPLCESSQLHGGSAEMVRNWIPKPHKYLLGICAALCLQTGVSRAGDNEVELRALLEQQQRQIEELKKRLDSVSTAPVVSGETADPGQPSLNRSEVQKIVDEYLQSIDGKKQ